VSEPRSVAIVSAVSPYPADAGKKVVLAGLVDYWVQRLGRDAVHYVLIGGLGASAGGLPGLVQVSRPTRREQWGALCTRTIGGRRSIQESMLYAPRVRKNLRSVLAQIDADLEIYDTVRLAQYAEEIPAAPGQMRVVYLDDLFSVRYARMLAVLRHHPEVDLDPLGEFRVHVPAALAALVGRRAVQRTVLALERRLVARRETAAARTFDLSLLVSPVEAQALRSRCRTATVAAIPPVVDAPATTRRDDGRVTFVLLGLLSLPHNHDAAMTFLGDVMPEVVRRMPEVRVHVVGRGATPSLREAAARWPGHVSVDGFVPDLDGLLSRAKAVVAPLRFGSGVKIKVLEALARGVPVLATSVGAEGVRTGDGYGIVVQDDIARFPVEMERLAEAGTNMRLSAAARGHFTNTYARRAVYRHYDDIFAARRRPSHHQVVSRR
jgi:Glycosyl transferases group 1